MVEEFERLDTQIIATSTDKYPSQKAFADHCELSFPLVADFPAFAAAKAFGVYNEERMTDSRVTFVIDKQGLVRLKYIGQDHGDRPSNSYLMEVLEVAEKPPKK